ncbi:MAG: hypothetical protein WDM79_15160 [Terricaulis sp.]
MAWRALIAAVALAACAPEGGVTTADNAGAEAPGYALEVFAHDQEQIYLVSHSDGRAAAARAMGETSEVLTPEVARGLLTERQAALGADQGEEVVGLRAPGFSLSIKGDEKGAEGEEGAVQIAVNTGGGSMTIDARDEGENDRARVRFTGADEATARDFINDAEELSPEVKAAMLASLGL